MPDDESFFTITGSDDGGYGRVDPSTEAINPETDVVTLYTDLLTESFVGKWQDPWTGQSFDLFHELCSEGGVWFK